jgi:hypothetical protein
MGLYLGSERMSPAISFKPSGVKRFKQGTARSDYEGELTLPKVDFVPSLIIIWNIVEVDHKELAEEEDGEWDDSYIRYTHDGILLTAIY